LLVTPGFDDMASGGGMRLALKKLVEWKVANLTNRKLPQVIAVSTDII
jgi:hypothetical protein